MSKFLTAERPLSAALSLTLFATGLLSLSPVLAHAQTFARVIETHDLPRDPKHACHDLFAFGGRFQVVDTKYQITDGNGDPTIQNRSYQTERPAEIDGIVMKVLTDWVQARDYTLEQAEMLFQRDRNLDPRRTTYIHLETDGHPAMIRVFDGSTTVLRGGTPWLDASNSDSRAPIEIGNQGFTVPERIWEKQNPKRASYFWEISLLNIDRQLKEGVEAVLGHVAASLDLHYNDGELRALNKTTTLEARNMMIYAQTRANRVRAFSKYGFQPVLQGSSNGEIKPLELSPNSVWMSMKAEDFLKLHAKTTVFAKAKKPTSDDAAENFDSGRDKFQAHVTALEAKRLPITSMKDLMPHFQNVFRSYVKARTLQGQTPERNDAIIDFVESYFVLINSIPENLRHKNWVNLRNAIRGEILGAPNPWMALFHFALAVDRESVDSSIAFSQAGYDAFYRLPLRAPIRLFAPMEPAPVMHFTPDGVSQKK